jgi:hypothetical protein
LGAASFDASVGWMRTNYPLVFTEIHAFEAKPNVFRIPPRSEIGDQLYDSIHFHQVRVGVKNDNTKNELNFPVWIV